MHTSTDEEGLSPVISDTGCPIRRKVRQDSEKAIESKRRVVFRPSRGIYRARWSGTVGGILLALARLSLLPICYQGTLRPFTLHALVPGKVSLALLAVGLRNPALAWFALEWRSVHIQQFSYPKTQNRNGYQARSWGRLRTVTHVLNPNRMK